MKFHQITGNWHTLSVSAYISREKVVAKTKEKEIPPDGKLEDDSSNEIDELRRASILVRLFRFQRAVPKSDVPSSAKKGSIKARHWLLPSARPLEN